MSLKDDIARDRDAVFLNEDDFADRHIVEGREVMVVLYDEDILPNHPDFGVVTAKKTLQAKTGTIPVKQPGKTLDIDGRLYLILTVREELGMTVYSLSEDQ